MAVIAATMSLLSGCVVTVVRSPYQTCGAGDSCSQATTCLQSNVMTGSSAAGTQCTITCTPGVSTCPPDFNGNQGVCVATGTSAAQCFQDCTGGVGCNAGFTCTPTSTRSICIPNGNSAPSCGNSGQACCGGTTCSSPLACVAGLCQAPVACGGNGQACCAGAQPCNGTLTCSGNICQAGAPLAYEGCTPIGAQCGTGTTCQSPMIANPGPTGWCTLACNVGANECPNLPGAIVDCYILQNASQGQCYVACPTGSGCPTGTVCSMTDTMTASGVRICTPPTS